MGVFLRRATAENYCLADIEPGYRVYLKENGVQTRFFVAKHDYEAAINGVGRTLLVRDLAMAPRAYDASSSLYANSELDAYLTTEYFQLLEADIQAAAGATAIRVTGDDENVTTIQRSVFQLSAAEICKPGEFEEYFNSEGSTLPIAELLRPARVSTGTAPQWTRTKRRHNTGIVLSLGPAGNAALTTRVTSQGTSPRPAITLPSKMPLSAFVL